jgi:hypothetical protein
MPCYGTLWCRLRNLIVSFLESLLHELQDQLLPGDPAISAGQVAEAATSERLKQQALKEGRSCSSLATFLIEDGLRRHTVIQ